MTKKGKTMKEQNKKYELIDKFFCESCKKTVWRIRALRDFADVRAGDIGGYVEGEHNLSHTGACWIYDDAVVIDNALVMDDAVVSDQAIISGNAFVCNHAIVTGSARVMDYATVNDCARVIGQAVVKEYAEIYDNAIVMGNAVVGGYAIVQENARVSDRANVIGDAKIGGRALVYGNAEVWGTAIIKYGEFDGNIKKDLVKYIACSLNVFPIDGHYILYKRVNKIKDGVYASVYDPEFIYEDGKTAEVDSYVKDFDISCSSGLHVSTPFYFSDGDTLIAVRVAIEDIITCMEGKLRVKRLTVLGEVKF